jgi:hypothetical protein
LFGNALNLFKSKKEKDSKLEKGPKVQLHSHFDAEKYLEYHFTGPLIIGSNKDEIQVSYDTGVDWLAVDTDKCDECI